MAIYTIGDLHLSLGKEDKPMDIFEGWTGYLDKLVSHWNSMIHQEDIVIIPGDFCWAMNIESSVDDFRFLEKMPGQKILLKGNHDYWWTTMKKMESFLSANSLNSVKFLHNSAYEYDDISICGTRGWPIDDSCTEDEKILNREILRLRLSLEQANNKRIFVFLHYPPLYKGKYNTVFTEVLKEYAVEKCFYAHLHGKSIYGAVQGNIEGIEYKLVSADSLKFCPYKIN